jgi:hypothetical protein
MAREARCLKRVYYHMRLCWAVPTGEGPPELLQVRRNLSIHCRHVHLDARASIEQR